MKILLLEDAKATQLLVKTRLEREGHQVDCVDNGHQGFQLATSNSYDAIISDIQMPHWDGFKFIEAMQVVCPKIPIIIVSGAEKDEATRKRLGKYTNVTAELPKPFHFNDLFALLHDIPAQSHTHLSKKARIVCTIGPASNTRKIIGKMILAGMDVARLNFSHGTHEDHKKTLNAVRDAENEWNKPIAVLQDLCGPKIRTGKMTDGAITLIKGEIIVIDKASVIGTPERISTIAPEIIDDLEPTDSILLDDGLLELKVKEVNDDQAICEVVIGGILKSNKGMNLPSTTLSLPSVTEKDWQDLNWALENSVDYVALSFVRSADEIKEIKTYIDQHSDRDIRVVAKVEKPEAVKNIREIITAADAIMIARGDMGVELPAARVPRIQQEIIRLCWELNTPVITATQMLDSMTHNSRPTRAEVTDVSTAIREGTDAVMLSQETATGVDPVNVVRTMATIISEEEQHREKEPLPSVQHHAEPSTTPLIPAVAQFSTIAATLLLDPDGTLYPALSKWSRKTPSILVSKSVEIARQASLYKNIIPIVIQENLDRDAAVSLAMNQAIKIGCIRPKDLIAVVEGERLTKVGFQQNGAMQLVRVPGDSSDH